MVYSVSESAAREQEEKEAAAREAARKAAIREKIRVLENKVNECEDLCDELQSSKGNINNEITKWNDVYGNAMQSEILKSVKVTDVFEGVIADTIALEFTEALSQMNKNRDESEDLSGKVSSQISSLNNYINKLNMEIRRLYASL